MRSEATPASGKVSRWVSLRWMSTFAYSVKWVPRSSPLVKS
jgi:hypothetical protein